MQKPNGFDNVSAGGSFTPIEVGGHHLIIMDVREKKSKKGQDMLAIFFDTAKNDKQPKYFSDLYKKDTRPDKKWPNQGTKYIMIYDYYGERDAAGNLQCSKDFKGFITAVENSNSGFTARWGDNFGAQFKGKKVGGTFGLVESFYNGKLRTKPELRWFCEDGRADSQPIPNKKEDKKHQNQTAAPIPTTNDGFMNIPDALDDEELPF